jgi:hypothetical protein
MADISYPTTLRGAIQSSKKYDQAAGFLESDPAAGASYTIAYTEDQPVFLGFDLKFSGIEAMKFDSWARTNKIFEQGLFFNFPVGDMYGITWQEVRFLSTGVPSWSETGRVTGYSGCRVLIPSYERPDSEFVDELIESGITINEISALDVTVNSIWPTA